MDIKRTAKWWVLAIILIALSCSKAPLPTQITEENIEKQNNVGKIIVTAIDLSGNPVDSAEVYWDGTLIGLTPLEKNDVEIGTHTIRVQKKGYELYSEFVPINSSEATFIEAILKKLELNKGQLFITVDQDSAITVVLNANEQIVDIFYDRVRSLVLDPGGYFIKSEKVGYALFYTAVEVRVDTIIVQNIHLERIQNTQLPQLALAVPDSGQVNVPVVISWQSSNAERVDIDYVENPGLNGKREIVFQLPGKKYIQGIAYNNAGSVTVRDSIYISDPVQDPQLPPTIRIQLQPKTVFVGEPVTIRWQSENAINVAVDFVPTAGLDGAWQVKFDAAGEYVVFAHAYGPGGEVTDSDTVTVLENPAPELPKIVTFDVNPDSIAEGGSAVLSWEVTGENVRVILDQGIGEVPLSGNTNVSPSSTSLYTLYATNGAGTVSRSVLLKVGRVEPTPVAPPVIETFSVNPDSIVRGQSAVLSWNVTGENVKVIIDQGIGEVPPNGNVNVSPNSTTVYTLYASNSGGTVTKTALLKVGEQTPVPVNPPVINNFSVVPDSIVSGQTAVLSWDVTGENVRVVIDQGIGEVPPQGQVNVSPQTSCVYTLYASNSGGATTQTVSLKVIVQEPTPPALPVIDYFTVEPDTIFSGETATLKWRVSGENVRVLIDQGIGEVPASGEKVVSPPGNAQYTIYATNDAGTVYQSVRLIVRANQPADPPTITIQAEPRQVFIGQTVTLSWTSQNATQVVVDFVPLAGLEGQYQLTFSQPGEYTIRATAYGMGGEAHDEVVITVNDYPAPDLYFSAQPEQVEFGEPITLSWETNGYQVIIDHGIGIRGPAGTEEFLADTPGYKIFSATAYGEGEKTTVKKDTVFVNEPQPPQLPGLWLAVVDSVEVGKPALIEWHSQNADRVDVDFVQNPGLNGKAEIIFSSAGERVISATAYNGAGQTTVYDTLIVVESSITQQVLPIYVSSMATVAAIHPTIPQVVDNAGQTTIQRAGFYRVSAVVWYNSGDLQKNESFFILLHDEAGGVIYPQDANAGNYKVVQDEPGDVHVSERDAGTFYLTPGNITISLHHYYSIASQYPQFIVDGPIDGPESVHVISFKLEFIQ